MPLLDARPDAVDQLIRPGVTYTLTLPWPTGELAGRTFSSTLDGQALDVTVVGDTMTIEATDTITGALDLGVPVQFLLLEDIGGTDEPILVGTWTPSSSPRAVSSSTVTVAVGTATIEVTVNSSQASIAGLDARLDTAEADIDALQAADVALDGRLDALEAIEVLEHRFGTDGWTPFTTRVIVTGDAPQVYTPSVVSRRGRITASAAADSELREWFLHEDTNWPDIEVSATFYAPSNWDTGPPINRPQQGLVVRAQEVPGSPGTWRGFVVWLDMLFGTSGMLANTWQGDGGAVLTQGSGGAFTGPNLNHVRRQLHVRYARRFNAFDAGQYWCQADARTPDMWGMVDGDSVNIASMTDTSFNRNGVAVGNLSTTTKFFQVVDTTANDNIDAIAGGTVDFVSLLKSHWPRKLAVLLEGTTLLAKHWRPEEPEPDWGDADQVAALTMPTSPALPEGPGLAGVAAGHIHDSAWLEYGDLTFKRRG